MSALRVVAVLVAVLAVPSFAAPVYYTYNLSALGLANADANVAPTDENWFGFHGGVNYQQGNFSVNLASKTLDPNLTSNPYLQNVDFTIGQGSGNQSWSGYQAEQSGGGSTPSLNITTNAADAQVVFLMVNTFWGTSSASAEVVLTFEGGGQQTFTLYGNSDLRDHNDAPWRAQLMGQQGPYYWTTQVSSDLHDGKATFNESTCSFNEQAGGGCAPAPGGTVNGQSADWLGYRDVVGLFIDPAYAGQTLTGILIRDIGHQPDFQNWNLDGSRLWVWGVSVGSNAEVPEPTTFGLLASGIGIVVFLGARGRRAAN